jgi:alanyl-tRNA synthetase
MKYMTAEQIRETWLAFFRSKGHRIEESVSLIPQSDPTLLWINAGVAPLKKYFDGSETPPNPRLANVQKCIRTNDIDNVGKTARHHTFFEMLGNFSIGDYFKHDAIRYGFELLTDEKWFGFPLEKLYFTYYPDDLEARDEWISCGVDPSHVIPRRDNFWEIGPGPCGPDTEVYFDRGERYDHRGKELIEKDIENERYIEIWNIVFSQFNSKPNLDRSNYPELPSKNIDTGAGLERFACVLQKTETNFETDLFYPIIKRIEAISGKPYDQGMAFKVIADHIKALVFAISDGAILSNEGRGYVLRRLLRRAVKYGLKLGLDEPFLFELVDEVVRIMGVFYRNLNRTKDIVKRIVKKEEEKFFETIREGERHLLDVIEKEGNLLSGQSAFKLYDTYGFPIELTVEYAEEQGVKVDREGFYEELEKQKERSRKARNVIGDMKSQEEAYMSFKEPSQFIGYDRLETETTVIKVFPAGIVLKETPFYATSGGQVADQGTINGVQVEDVFKLPNGQFLHRVDATFEEGEDVLAIVDAEKRAETIRNHSAAHLFHQAIKDILGKHAHQQGSQVAPKAWRFDFNHFETEDDQTILAIEKLVKHYIKEEPLTVHIRNMPLDEAKAYGAQALFGEKYGDIVRVVDMGWSKELCGGTHVANTKEIVDFAITSYESIGSGIYRMEGITGPDVKGQMKAYLAPFQKEVDALIDKALRSMKKTEIPKPPEVKGSYQDIIDFRGYIVKLKEIVKEQEKARLREKQRDVLKDVDRLIEDRRSRRQVIVTREIDSKVLKQVADAIYDKINGEVLFLANISDGKATFICKSARGNAAELVKKAAELTHGSGGGRGHFAQGGTQDLTDFEDAMQAINELL